MVHKPEQDTGSQEQKNTDILDFLNSLNLGEQTTKILAQNIQQIQDIRHKLADFPDDYDPRAILDPTLDPEKAEVTNLLQRISGFQEQFRLIVQHLEQIQTNEVLLKHQNVNKFRELFIKPAQALLNAFETQIKKIEPPIVEEEAKPAVPEVFEKLDKVVGELEKKLANPSFDPRNYTVEFVKGAPEKDAVSILTSLLILSRETVQLIKSKANTPEDLQNASELNRKYIVRVENLIKSLEKRINDIDVKKISGLAEYQTLETAIDSIDFGNDKAAYFRAKKTELQQKNTAFEARLATITLNEAQNKFIQTIKNKYSDALTKIEKAIQSIERIITPEELKVFTKWQKFLYFYGKHSGRGTETGLSEVPLKDTPRGRAIIRGDETVLSKQEITDERHRVFARWYQWNWSAQVRTIFDAVVTKKAELPEVDHDIEVQTLAGAGQEFEEGQRITWGVSKILDIGAHIYKHPQSKDEIFGAVKDQGLLTKDFDHLFGLGYFGTGEFTGAEYLQAAYQFLVMHDESARKLYGPLLKGHLGQSAINYFGEEVTDEGSVEAIERLKDFEITDICFSRHDPDREKIASTTALLKGKIKRQLKKDTFIGIDKTKPNKGEYFEDNVAITFNGKQMYEVFVSDSVDITDADKKLVEYRFTLFVLEQDRKRLKKKIRENGDNPNDPQIFEKYNPLSFADAQFIANIALNAGFTLQKFAAQDRVDYVSKMFLTRLMFFEEYRRKKIGKKNLGPTVTNGFFKKLVPETGFVGYLLANNGMNLEDLWMLAGVGDGTGVGEDLPASVTGGAIQDYFAFIPTENNGLVERGRPKAGTIAVDEMNDLRIVNNGAPTNWELPADLGKIIYRYGTFVKSFYSLITGSETIIDDWLSDSVVYKTSKIRNIYNDQVSYYFGDLKINTNEQGMFDSSKSLEQNERDLLNSERLVRQRKLFAQKGYILVRNKVDTKETTIKGDYYYTPVFDFFNMIPDERLAAISAELHLGVAPADVLLELSIHDPVKLQEILKRELNVGEKSTVHDRTQEIFMKWLLIGEMSLQADAFKKKDLSEKKKIVDAVLSGMNQDYFNIRYATVKSRLKNESVRQAGFGKFSFDDVVDMFYKAGWISKAKGFDIQLKLYLRQRRTVMGITEKADFKPEAL